MDFWLVFKHSVLTSFFLNHIAGQLREWWMVNSKAPWLCQAVELLLAQEETSELRSQLPRKEPWMLCNRKHRPRKLKIHDSPGSKFLLQLQLFIQWIHCRFSSLWTLQRLKNTERRAIFCQFCHFSLWRFPNQTVSRVLTCKYLPKSLLHVCSIPF